MSVNFFNSAGTDLDNLFYTNNGNAGAVGFIEASGQDLGNRYTTVSTLGYAVGLVNSAGTDLGYLRGNYAAASMQDRYDNLTTYYNGEIDNGSWYIREAYGFFNVGCTAYGTGCSWALAIQALNGNTGRYSMGTIEYLDNSTADLRSTSSRTQTGAWLRSSYSTHGATRLGEKLPPNSATNSLTIYSGVCDAHPSRVFAIELSAQYDDAHVPGVSAGLRVLQRVWNDAADTGWQARDFWFS
jgi:hypothetical protein